MAAWNQGSGATRHQVYGNPTPSNTNRYDNKHHYQTILGHIDRFCRSFNYNNINQTVDEIRKLELHSLKSQDVQGLFGWVVSKVRTLDAGQNYIQCFFWIIILGHMPSKILNNQSKKRAKGTFDRLLDGLYNCLLYNGVVPNSNYAFLETIALVLVQKSSCDGWLALATFVYPYLGPHYVVNADREALVRTYGRKYFPDYAELLLHYVKTGIHITNLPENVSDHRGLLENVLRSAPNQDECLSRYAEIFNYFFDSKQKEELFSKVSQSSSRKGKKSGKKLSDLAKNLHNFQGYDSMFSKGIHAALVAFAKAAEKPIQSEATAFLELISSQHLSTDQVCEVLLEVSGGKRRELLLQLLREKRFEDTWVEIRQTDKLCVVTRFIGSIVKEVDKSESRTENVYQTLEHIMSCSLIKHDKQLVNELGGNISEKILIGEDTNRILMAFKYIEKLSPVVQENYKNHVEDVLKKNHRLLRKEIETLKQWGESSFGQCLLSCAVDVMGLPKETDPEKRFKEMIEWCDVWVILLNAKNGVGCLGENKTFEEGRSIWQELLARIAKGNISVNFLNDVIKKHKRKLSQISDSLSGKPVGNDDTEFSDSVSKLLEKQHDLSEKFKLLNTVINFVKKELQGPRADDGSLEQVVFEFNERERNWRTKNLSELGDDFWGPLLPLLKSGDILKPLIKSVSFKEYLRRSSLERNEVNRVTTVTEGELLNDVYAAINYLIDKGIDEFRVAWVLVFNDPDSLTHNTMEKLLGSLDDEEKLGNEFTILESYFEKKLPDQVKEYMKDYVTFPTILRHVNAVIGVLDIFELVDATNPCPTVSTLISFLNKFQSREDTDLKILNETMVDVKKILAQCIKGEADAEVMKQLSCANGLYTFVKGTVGEDIRFLIDAVEEHSDHFVNESLVSDLIDIHRFVVPLITWCQENSQGVCCSEPLTFLEKLVSLSTRDNANMAAKICVCTTSINSLEGLYKSVANRGEVTKEIIANCLSRGSYTVSLEKSGACEAKMSYTYDHSSQAEPQAKSYSLQELHDLRSRAHLIVSSTDKHPQRPAPGDGEETNEDIDFADFIEQVNVLTEITTLFLQLWSSGYVKYREKYWKTLRKTNELRAMKKHLQAELQDWETILSDARQKYQFLNYYRSDQLCVLYDFLTNRSQEQNNDVLSLINFVDPRIKKEQLEIYQAIDQQVENSSRDDPGRIVSIIGDALERIFENTTPRIPPIVDDKEHPASMHDYVSPGELFVAVLEEESLLTANVMITLYENTSNAFPEPSQVVFCGAQTTWEEVQLVLQRCFAETKSEQKRLFCIANVEQLTNEIQFKLISVIKEKQYNADEAGSFEENNYRLALICRGGDHHHIVEEFAQYSHHISGMSDQALSMRLKSRWPGIKIVTSSLPGLGKTERIQQEVLQKKLNVVKFVISGPLDQSVLIQRLKKLKFMDYHCLHLDIGEVDDPVLLDTFLLQLFITGMVSSGTKLYHLPTGNVYIEIANTLNERLRESLVFLKYFNRVDLQWRNYGDLVVSSEVTSKLQVACQYLDIYDRGILGSTDVHFTGPNKVAPLPPERCRKLLAKYYSTNSDVTFTSLKTFLGIFADQLLKFSRSAFFKISNLKTMLDDKARGVRENLFRALLEVSKEFASRSIKSCNPSGLQEQNESRALMSTISTNSMTAGDMVERVKGMIQWDESNHLLVVFQAADSQSIAAVYRDKSLVPKNVEDLLESQKVEGKSEALEDFRVMGQDQLQKKLEQIACNKPPKKDSGSYALTPDNILKMILIILRVRANVPVMIMGETGCGKTSLVRYLASNICQVNFFTFNFHAGVTEDAVRNFIQERDREAKRMRKAKSREQIWVFLDEINTCDHLGLINDVVCHHTLLSKPLSKNLVFIAACNPYKLRPTESMKTAGLEGKNTTDEYSRLVYRVHPLPEAMTDYVWDYGSLAEKDEKSYIERMVEMLQPNVKDLFVKLLTESQIFIRKAEKNHYSVSLRDVRRCILLVQWFMGMIAKREKLPKMSFNKSLKTHVALSKKYDKKPEIRSIVLALAHSYLSRLGTAELRKEYRERMNKLFLEEKITMDNDDFSAIVRIEEEDYLNRMELPPGTAKNTALRENVFVILVSILNRIPVFVVGKPGCSKSLSVQLIRSNLRGRDSKDPLFQRLPQLYVVSFQGSESSTSEGIVKVFEKASKYKSHDKDGNILPVVLLDEVGLAENSRYNPLKVLHNLLEPGNGELPEVAVVGISNWALDAAKMNRATHLSRPEPTMQDLYETGQSLHHEFVHEDDNKEMADKDLRGLAEGYFEYQSTQRHENFHGLRDYYSLIKSLSQSESSDLHQINTALQRNFGGLSGELKSIQKIFLDKLKHKTSRGEEVIIPVGDLIKKNLEDPRARHLMLITSGNSAVEILKQSLSQVDREIITIFGSRFEEDLSEDYNYRMLSRIILCMERDCILILRDLERIYGSLYDMLNQNYAVVGKRKNCRVALGAYSNPMCHVNDHFRCIVLTDYNKVNYADPPFLNRFEKQLLRFSDVLNEDQQISIKELDDWVQEISTVQGLESHFQVSDMFIGYHEDTLPSLVLQHSQDIIVSRERIVEKCKDDLMWIATPDGVIRAQMSDRLKRDPQDVRPFCESYFDKPVHNGLVSFMEAVVDSDDDNALLHGDDVGSKTIVMTYSTIHTDIANCLGKSFACQTERLGAYKSEKQLSERVKHFWTTSEKDLLVLQCKPDLDGAHMLLARSIIEDKRDSYKKTYQQNEHGKQKHVCIVVHLQRGRKQTTEPWQFSFLCGWKQVFLDVLDEPPVSLDQIRTKSIPRLLTSEIWPLDKIAQNSLLWCLSCMKYTQHQRPLESVLHIVKDLFSSDVIYQTIEKLVLDLVNVEEEREEMEIVSWQVKVACDREALVNSSTLLSAMENHVSRIVRRPLAKLVYFLEKENSWPRHVFGVSEDEDDDVSEYEDMWCDLVTQDAFFNSSELPEALGPESYILDGASLDLHVPFCQIVFKRVDALKDLILEEYEQFKENESNLDQNGHLKPEVQLKEIERYSDIIANKVPEIQEYIPCRCRDSYMADLFDVMSACFRDTMPRAQRTSIATRVFLSYIKQNLLKYDDDLHFYVQLHLFVWLSKEQILDQLRLVHCCQRFMPAGIVENVVEEFLSISDEQQLSMDVDVNKYNMASDDTEDESDDSIEENELQHENNEACGSSYVPQSDVQVDGTKREMIEKLENQLIAIEQSEYDTDESDESEEKEQCKEDECFEEVLVTMFCEAMLPSQKTVEVQNGGIESWIRNASLLLPLAYQISHQNPALHFLRLCVDFAKMSFVPSSPEKQYYYPLYILNEIADKLKPEYLDNADSFNSITEDLIKPLADQVEEEKRKALQKFSALFYGRCLDTNVDTSGAHLIVEQVLSFDSADLVLVMSPVVLRLLMVEENESPGIFINIITIRSKIEDYPCLQNIDNVFKDLLNKNLIHQDSYSAVMLCDLIQPLLKFDDRYSIEDLDSSDCELLRCVRAAVEVVYESKEDNYGLVLLSSVAFLRAFFTTLSNFIIERSNVTRDLGSPYTHVMGEINCLLTVGNSSRRSTLQMYFLKQLYQTNISLYELRKLCQESEILPAIKDVFIDNRKNPKAKLLLSDESIEYKYVQDAYWKMVNEEDETDMLAYIAESQNAPRHRLALMRILINTFYVKRSEQKLTEKEENLVKWFSKNFGHFPLAVREILVRIIGQKDFDHPRMQLSLESSVDEIELALLILHVTCVFAEIENSPLTQYILNPQKCKQSYILANRDVTIHQAFKKRTFANSPLHFTCSCGLRCAFMDNEVNNMCPSCSTIFSNPNPMSATIETEQTTCKGYSPQTPTTVPKSLTKHHTSSKEQFHWNSRTNEMSSPVFRALHLIVHACFYGGVAMGISTKADLSSLLNTKNIDLSRDSKDPEDFCFDHIEADVKCLMTLLSCQKEIVFKVMHTVVEKGATLITMLNNNMCSTPEQRVEWEQQFFNLVQDVIPQALGPARKLKEMVKKRLEDENEMNVAVEDQILELDDYPNEPVLQNQQLKRLFRVTRQPSFQDFHARFVNSKNDFQEKHGFLSLFFARFQELSVVSNLFHLLNWARLVSSALTHRISRKDAESSSIDDFINGYLLKHEKKNVDDVQNQKKLFSNFKRAWNNVVELVNQQLPQTEHEMPRLTETDPIAYCLTESDSGIYLRTAIQILVTLQNSFLDGIIFLSSHAQHPALRFLEKNSKCSAVSSISIQEATEKEIICFRWSNELFKYAQNNPDYGQGEEISYDFQEIEINLSNEVVLGKCHLTGSLSKFIFSKELFHSSGTMLTEIRALLPQNTTLPENLRQGLSRLKERRIHDAQKLLQHIEGLIFLLKFKLRAGLSTDDDITLEEFVDKTRLPCPFPVSLLPDPKSSIKLKHIAALYEALEDLLADGAIDGLSTQFRHELPDEAKDELWHLVSVKEGQIKLQEFLTALRRFVFRYLSSEKFLPDPNVPLNSCIKEGSLWSPATPPDVESIPREMTLECIHSLITHLQDLDQERKGRKTVKGGRSAFPKQLSNKKGRRTIKF